MSDCPAGTTGSKSLLLGSGGGFGVNKGVGVLVCVCGWGGGIMIIILIILMILIIKYAGKPFVVFHVYICKCLCTHGLQIVSDVNAYSLQPHHY